MVVLIGAFVAILVGIEALRMSGHPISDLWVWPAFAVVLIIRYREKLIAAYYHAFVKYPATTTADFANAKKTRTGFEHDAKASRIIAGKLDADADIADAVIKRERARAALEEAEQEYENLDQPSRRSP